MAFVKGQSGNPGGRSKELQDVIFAARAHTIASLATLHAIATSEKAPPAARVSAAVALLDRAWGKPMQPAEVTGKGGAPLMPALSVVIARE